MLLAFVILQLAQFVQVRSLEAEATVRLPVRWCVLGDDVDGDGTWDPGERGVPAFTDPAGVGEPNTDEVAWRRHERATDHVWKPGADISLRSAFTKAIRSAENLHFPIIPDPCDPVKPFCPGEYGDVVNPGDELMNAYSDCEIAWDGLEVATDTNLEGPIVIILRRFVNDDGIPIDRGGVGNAEFILSDVFAFCDNPPPVISVIDPRVAVIDNSLLSFFEFDTEHTLAHEFGHLFALGHGDGLDDGDPEGTGPFDDNCDLTEEEVGESLMTQGGSSNVITALQAIRAHPVADVMDGATEDPPGVILPGDVVSDHRVDAVHDVTAVWVDMVTVALRDHTPSETTIVSHSLFGMLPPEVTAQYVVFLDLDRDSGTGGAPAVLNFETDFRGAEVVTRVVVSPAPPPPQSPVGGELVIPTVWRFEAGVFAEVIDTSITAEVRTVREFETGLELHDAVVLRMPSSVKAGAADSIRIQAIAQQLDGDQLDRLPEAEAEGSDLRLVVPEFPECSVTPATLAAGEPASVEADDLLPDQTAKVVLGDELMATGPIDQDGRVSVDFFVPVDARSGSRLVTVGVQGLALTADCFVEIDPDASAVVAVDIKPQSCPNPLQTKAQGRLPVAVLGNPTFDVPTVEPASITLEGVSALRWGLEDVATPFVPFSGKTEAGDCTNEGPDGFLDLILHFSNRDVAAALGAIGDGEVRTLRLRGSLRPEFGGTAFVGEDVVVVRTPGQTARR